MSLIRKRRLTDQQSRRIRKQKKNQQHALDTELLEGLVVAHYGKQLEVQVLSLPDNPQHKPKVATGEPEPFWQDIVLNDIWRCHTSTNLPMLVAGDRVRWRADSNTGLGFIEALHERESVITRPDRYHHVKPVASNIDLMVVVFAPLPVPSPQLIDRYLVMSEFAGVRPLLVLNKNDLIEKPNTNTSEEPKNSHEEQLLKEYADMGYDTLSTNRFADLSPLIEAVTGKSVVFLGQSGVGKSSLINAMHPEAMQRINAISENSDLGQHTTTTTRLIPFMSQGQLNNSNMSEGALIDSPGIREYGLWHLTPDDIQAGFIDMQPYVGLCKFRDCKHINEPKCAFKQAVEDGEILQRRFESLLLLQAETQPE